MKNNLKIKLIDTTLRDGEQMPGLVFSLKDKIEIVQMLNDLGIDEIEAGNPSVNDSEIEDIKKLKKLKLKSLLFTWSRAKISDIIKSEKTGCSKIHIAFPVSDLLLASIGKDEKWLYETLITTVDFAKKRFDSVSVGAMDSTRANFNTLKIFLKTAQSIGVSRIRLADTVGFMNPIATYKFIKKIKKNLGNSATLEFHAHNDLGMATANSISAAEAGCDALDVTLNGIGERAGNASLDEVIMSLKFSLYIKFNFQTDLISSVCNRFSKIIGIPIHKNKPVTGDNNFIHESGIHCSSLIYDRKTFELYHSSEIGRKEPDFIIGKHSGSKAILKILSDNNIITTRQKAEKILLQVKKRSIKEKRNISINELIKIHNQN